MSIEIGEEEHAERFVADSQYKAGFEMVMDDIDRFRRLSKEDVLSLLEWVSEWWHPGDVKPDTFFLGEVVALKKIIKEMEQEDEHEKYR